MDRLVKGGRFEDAPGLLRVVARRAYAGEAAAAQTGVGSPTTRGLVAAVRSSAASPLGVIDVDTAAPDMDEMPPSLEAPPWMRTLAAVLAVQGWHGRSRRCMRSWRPRPEWRGQVGGAGR